MRLHAGRSSSAREAADVALALQHVEHVARAAWTPARCSVLCRARWPLRMRVSMSPSGSVIDIVGPSLPARLDHAGDLARRGQIAQRDAAELELAIVAARAAGQLAAQLRTRTLAARCAAARASLRRASKRSSDRQRRGRSATAFSAARFAGDALGQLARAACSSRSSSVLAIVSSPDLLAARRSSVRWNGKSKALSSALRLLVGLRRGADDDVHAAHRRRPCRS